jgi:aminoglycoside phosphotransferase (APT) family kinase protein
VPTGLRAVPLVRSMTAPTVSTTPVAHPSTDTQEEQARQQMTTGPKDDSALAEGFTRWLADRRAAPDPVASDITLSELRRPSGGYSSETILVDASWPSTGRRESFVIRMAPAEAGTFRHYDLAAQWQAQTAATGVGVPVADPVLETDIGWLGAPFIVMPLVEGHIIGPLAHRDDWLCGRSEDERGRLYRTFVTTLTTIHRAEVSTVTGVPRRNNRAELAFWDDYLLWSSAGQPVATLVDGLAWCARHLPPDEPPPALLWGDVRFENMIFGDDLVPRAVLDWDMTSIGAPEHDLAWFTSLDLTMHRLFGDRPVGFPDRQETVDVFETASGRKVGHLEWYETLAMVRSTAIMTRLGFLRRQAGLPLLLPIDDNPLLDLIKERIG